MFREKYRVGIGRDKNENVGLGEGSPAIGVPFFWPSAAMPDTVIKSWSSMVFLKFNGAKFSASDYPVLAKVFPSLVLPEARGDFIGLGEAAKRNVGTGTNQIPDMGSFTLSVSGTGYQKLPSGFILQWGSIGAPSIAQDVVTHFPIAFPNRCLRVLVSQDYTPDSGAVGYIACAGFSSDPVKFISRASTPGLGASFLALGC